jgi:hypothetical protein
MYTPVRRCAASRVFLKKGYYAYQAMNNNPFGCVDRCMMNNNPFGYMMNNNPFGYMML